MVVVLISYLIRWFVSYQQRNDILGPLNCSLAIGKMGGINLHFRVVIKLSVW